MLKIKLKYSSIFGSKNKLRVSVDFFWKSKKKSKVKGKKIDKNKPVDKAHKNKLIIKIFFKDLYSFSYKPKAKKDTMW